MKRKINMAARKPLSENVTLPVPTTAMADLHIQVPVNQITQSPDGRFINLPWGASGTFSFGSKVVEARIGKAGKVVILTKQARRDSAKAEKPAIDLNKIL
jgi:hypothetical protein|tara:strand:+ start:252 stop:551 length:300 start_codon:yes stop_codon:yes gene_type:complete